MDNQDNISKAKKVTKEYYDVLHGTDYSSEERSIMFYTYLDQMMKLLNPEIKIPKPVRFYED